jgi:(1->4)-alpha-D-glucan 1-alpha-D-glucosylmutase
MTEDARPFRATYRLQLGPGLDFARVAELVPYLARLGVSHLYLSPALQAREGSSHGYDVIDPTRISDALGGEDGLRALAQTAHEHGLGILLDIVPNHMAVDDANPFWADPALRARYFDLDPDAAEGPGHRRFFDIDELAGVRMEDAEVFETTHRLVLGLVADGVVDGLRIDHPDGLANPREYLQRLRDGGAEHVWVEKILSLETDPPEALRPEWPVEGTVGYEFANDVTALFVDPAAEPVLTALAAELGADTRPFHEVAAEAKLEQAQTTFTPEVERLRRLWAQAPDLQRARASLPLYRTYVEPATGRVTDDDRAALAIARRHGLPEALQHALLLEAEDGPPAEFITRFQQTTGPVMAKGVEDTAFYRYVRLLALNEVGGDPGRFGIDVATFHAANRARPVAGLLASTTHDTKRSHDVRARLSALTAMAEDWAAAVRSWHAVNAPLRDGGAPSGAEELLIYQTLVGAWPIDAARLEPYLVKAMREAKVTSNWIDPDEEHEAAVLRFATTLLDHGPFRDGFDGVAARVDELGRRVALAQTLLRLTVPGVPDIYQGDEGWTYSLVDPDNRRAVGWGARREALDELIEAGTGAPVTGETAKLGLIAAVLDLRRRRPEAFTGGYEPIPAGDGVVAFLRGVDVLVAVAVRDAATAADGWMLPDGVAGRWRDVLSGAEHELPGGATLAGVLGSEGRALLERVG